MKALIAALILSASVGAQATTLTVYTDRPTARIQPVADQLKAAKGVDVVIVEKNYADIAALLEQEGANTTADVIFVKDLVFLKDLTNKGALQPLNSAVKARVPTALKDKDNNWVAISFRARTIVYDPSRVNPSELSTYEDLADPKWAGRLCMRTSKGTYNVALIASFVHHLGAGKAKVVTAGILDNLANDVSPNDTTMMTEMANGICDVGISNTYYLGQVLNQNPNFPIKPFFANQETTGTHINGAGAGVSKYSKNADLAEEFIGLMLEEKNQLAISGAQMEYPAAKGVSPNTLIKDWGSFKVDLTNWTDIGDSVPEANSIIKDLNYK